MEPYIGNNNAWRSRQADQRTGLTDKVPMHPDDFNALLAWITAKRFYETNPEKKFPKTGLPHNCRVGNQDFRLDNMKKDNVGDELSANRIAVKKRELPDNLF